MSNATRQTSDVVSSPLGTGRRLKMGGIPRVPTSLLLASIVTVSVVVLGSWYTLALVRSSFLAARFDDVWVNAIVGLLALL
jgi:polar amino acid transport system permease protein